MERFSDLGREQSICKLFEGTPYEPFSRTEFAAGQGDETVSASRMFLEGIDFNLKYFPLKHLGYKAVVGVTGELYAAMAHPKSLRINIGVSAKLDYEQIRELWSGAVSAASSHGYASVSLDLDPSLNGLCIALSAAGLRSAVVSSGRPQPKSKDLLCVSGSLGAAYMGQQVLERRFSEIEKYKMMVGSYLMPELDADLPGRMEALGMLPSTGCFVTRGLSDAVMRISRGTGLGAKVYAGKIPFEGNTISLAREMGIDAVSAAMNGGDDYRIIYVVPILCMERFCKEFQTFDVIGHLAQPDAGTVVVTPEGAEIPLSSQGWK